MLPTVGHEASPVVVSDSPHLAEIHSSDRSHSSRFCSEAHCRKSFAAREALATVMMSPVPSMPKPRPLAVFDAVDHALGPTLLDADHDHGRDIGIGASTDQCTEEELQVLAELQPAIGVRDRHHALDVVGNRFGRGVGEIVQRQHDDMVAHADPAVLAPPAHDLGTGFCFFATFPFFAISTTAWS